MKKSEFIKFINEIGIDLKIFGVNIEGISKAQFSIGVYQEKTEWIVYTVDERNNLFESFRGDEESAFDILLRKLFVRLDEQNFVNDSITKEVIKTPRIVVFDFLRTKFSMDDWELEDTWKYLLQNFRVLNEVKYFSLKKSFVPFKDAYVVEGYSAQNIFEQTYLDEIGAYNYLVYLKKNPKQAMSDLKAGLPRR